MDSSSSTSQAPQASVVQTLQSLIVAFVLAMAFRSFVLEGFVIPTGSMAPTLLGQHGILQFPQTGHVGRFDLSEQPLAQIQRAVEKGQLTALELNDPMMPLRSRSTSVSVRDVPKLVRGGDRILILKAIYPFFEPDRWDVVVFKTPTDPVGEKENYIKRLVILPGEQGCLIDGDVFASPAPPDGRGDLQSLVVQRKPEHVQRNVWQPVYHSDCIPIGAAASPTLPLPWIDDTNQWLIGGRRSYRCNSSGLTTIRWNEEYRPIDDYGPYNILFNRERVYPVSDIRVSAALVPDQAGLSTTLQLHARGHVFEFTLKDGQASVSMTAQPDEGGSIATPPLVRTAPIEAFEPGRALDVEFWHVDQSLSIFINDRLVVDLQYQWKPAERLVHATGQQFEMAVNRVEDPTMYLPPAIQWSFDGSPVTLHRVRLDRDLHYQPIEQAGSPSRISVLSPDQFFMCGDNSPHSLDSRRWGRPHRLVAEQLDPTPYVVPRELILGKAWLVYFPAPQPVKEGGMGVIPDFGRVRFIR